MVLMAFYTSHVLAQNDRNIPETVIKAFAARYPKAEVKSWTVGNNGYTAKAKEGGHKYFATFDKNAGWIGTTTKVNWPWNLPPAIKIAFKKSKYGAWNIYTVNILESASGRFYQIVVDDRNHPVDIFHQELVNERRLLEFRSNGEFIKESAKETVSL